MRGRGLIIAAPASGSGKTLVTAGLLRHLRHRGVRRAGVVSTRVSGERHSTVLEAAMTRHLPEITCLGFLPSDPEMKLPERHLVLVPAGEAAAKAAISRAAISIAAQIDVDRLI